MEKNREPKVLATNRQAAHEYYIYDEYEAGVELKGTEVKSVCAGKVNLKDSYVVTKNGEALVYGMHISPYEKGNIFNHDPDRVKRLLLHRREIAKLSEFFSQEGYTLVPLRIYLRGSRVKVLLGVCKGKKTYDKRNTIAERDAKRQIDRAIKERY